MHRPALLALVLLMSSAGAKAEDSAVVPPQVTFVTSTGYWEESGEPLSALDPNAATGEAADKQGPARRGYYKLIALRQADGTAQIHLQQIEATPGGPVVRSSAELEEFSTLKAYVTDIRPETSTGVSAQPGMFATVFLKTDPNEREPETWTVLIDDLGDIKIERASN